MPTFDVQQTKANSNPNLPMDDLKLFKRAAHRLAEYVSSHYGPLSVAQAHQTLSVALFNRGWSQAIHIHFGSVPRPARLLYLAGLEEKHGEGHPEPDQV
jgi:hypothetical protein